MSGAAAALLILAAASTTAAPEALQCPAIAGQTLVYIDIFDGPPEQQADLAPDQSTPGAGGTTTNTWKLQPGADGLYVKCGYGKKLAGPYARMETIRLPGSVKGCRAEYRSGPAPNDLTLQKFSCR